MNGLEPRRVGSELGTERTETWKSTSGFKLGPNDGPEVARMLKAAGIDEENMPMHQSELTSAQSTLLNKLAQNYRGAIRRYAPVISAHGEILPRLTPQQVEASSHRSLILKVLTHSQPDLVGSSIGSPPYTYGTVESKRSNWRTLPKLEVLEPPADLVNCHSRDERQRRYTSCTNFGRTILISHCRRAGQVLGHLGRA